VDSLRVRWVPLVRSFRRLGAFAVSPHPGVPSFPGLRLLCPIRLLLGALAFRWGLPYLLSARLHIPQEVSRVPYGGLKQDGLGGALSTVPSTLCGSPDGAWSRGRFIHALFHWAYGITRCRAYCCTLTGSVSLAGILGKVCQGHSSPKDDMRFMEIHPVVSQSSTTSWLLAFASLCLSGPCCSRYRAVYALRPNDSRGTCIPQGGNHIPPWLLLDSRVVDVTMASNPICAACILLETLIFQELYPCAVCCRHPREQKTLKPNKSLLHNASRRTRRAMHASCESPWHSLAKHCILDTCFLLTVPFRGMLLTPQGGPRCLAPTAHQIPVYLMVFSTFLRRAFTAHYLYTPRSFDIPPCRFHGAPMACHTHRGSAFFPT
jgi:hypothetical protein